MRKALIALLIPALAACAATPPPAQTAAGTPPPPRQSVPVPAAAPAPPVNTGGFRAPRVMNVPGLESVIGLTANALVRQFGTARLDVEEGDVRKLQFTGEPCVLDVYLYPLSPGAEPTATYVDARRASDGLDVDRASCVRALLGR